MIDEIIKLVEGDNKEEALALLRQIRENNRGHERLGDPDMVVITHPGCASADLFDSVRFFTKAMFGGHHSAANLRTSSLLVDSPAMKVLPDWFKRHSGWVDTDSFTQLVLQLMVEVDLHGDALKEMPFPYDFDSSKLREQLLFDGKIKRIDDPLPTQESA